MSGENELAVYQSKDGSIELGVRVDQDTVWLMQKQIARLFATQRPAITKHLGNIFKEGELVQKSVCSILEHTAPDGKVYRTKYYNLDAIISVGYRVNSKKATLFRIWATKVLKQHIVSGYTLNKDRLGNLENLYRYMKDTLTVTSMNINRLRIDSARQKDLAVLAEDIDAIKSELDALKKKLKKAEQAQGKHVR